MPGWYLRSAERCALRLPNPVNIGEYNRYVFAHTALVELGVTAVLASPLVVSGESAGLLLLLRISEERPFSKRDAQFAQLLSMAISARMENLRLRQLDRDVRDEVEAVQRTIVEFYKNNRSNWRLPLQVCRVFHR